MKPTCGIGFVLTRLRTLVVCFAALSTGAFSFSAHAKPGFYPTRFAWAASSVSGARHALFNSGLNYYGGPVISNPKIWVVFWDQNVDPYVKSGIGDFFKAVTNSTYQDFLSQYDTTRNGVDGHPGTNQAFGRGQFMGTITLKPSFQGGVIDDSDIQVELQKQIDAGFLPKPDENTLYMVYFPVGMTVSAFGMTSCQDFCAYHSMHGTPSTSHFFYGVMPDIGGMCSGGCGFAMDQFESETAISSHEYMEACTDPYPTPGTNPAYPQAWNDSQGSEIGDLCVGGLNGLKTPTGSFIVQSEWDNSHNGCTNKDWTSP